MKRNNKKQKPWDAMRPKSAGIFLLTIPLNETVEQKAAREALELEIKTAQDALLLQVKSILETKTTALDTQLKTLNDAFIAHQSKGFELPDALKKSITDLELGFKELKESPRTKELKSIADQLKAHKVKFDNFKTDKKSFTIDLELKATQTSTDITGRDNYFMWHEGGAIGKLPVREPFIRELFRNRTTTSEYVKYTDQETVVRDAKNVALCGVTTSNTKVTWKVFDLKVDKVRDFTTICIDMMDDYDFVEGEIRTLLNESLNLKIDVDLLSGTGVSPILFGLAAYASTFSAYNADPEARYVDTVPYANIIDLISIAGAQIRTFGKNNAYRPNYVLVNPHDMQVMKLQKDTIGNYLKTPMLRTSLFQDTNGSYFIDGMRLIENSGVTANEFWIGDFTKGTVYARPGVGIEFAYENRDNFEQELVTVKIYERLNLLVRTVDRNAFMHVTNIATALIDIDSNVSS